MEYNEDDWNLLCEETDALTRTGRFRGRHDAFQEAARRNPHLSSTPPSTTGVQAPPARGSGGAAEGQLDRLARDLQRRDGRLTYAQAYSRVLAENPQLYAQYLAENADRGGSRG